MSQNNPPQEKRFPAIAFPKGEGRRKNGFPRQCAHCRGNDEDFYTSEYFVIARRLCRRGNPTPSSLRRRNGYFRIPVGDGAHTVPYEGRDAGGCRHPPLRGITAHFYTIPFPARESLETQKPFRQREKGSAPRADPFSKYQIYLASLAALNASMSIGVTLKRSPQMP